MAHFNANPYLEALDRPTLTIGPHTFHGRYLSLPHWLLLSERVIALQENRLSVDERQGLIRDMTDLIFPPPPWWRPWAPWARVELMKLPLPVQLEALKNFIRSQARATNPLTWDRRAAEATPPAPGVLVQAAS